MDKAIVNMSVTETAALIHALLSSHYIGCNHSECNSCMVIKGLVDKESALCEIDATRRSITGGQWIIEFEPITEQTLQE